MKIFWTVALTFTIVTNTASTVSAQTPAPEVASEAVEPAVATPEPYDYKDRQTLERIRVEKGIAFPAGYDFSGCLPFNENDSCLPTGYIQAVEQGEPWVAIWDAEVMIRTQDDVAADKMLKLLDSRYPNNSKIKWLLAKNLFFRSERLPEADREKKGVILKEGLGYAEECMELAPNDINCLLHYGTLLGRSGTNERIFKTLSNGKLVEQAWLDAVATKTHYRFPSSNTAVGATYYGLGVYYRLVPDSWWLNFFFGIRGDIDKAIKYLELAMGTKSNQVELYTELAASNYCKFARDDSEVAKENADRWVGVCLKLKANDRVNEISQGDCTKLQADNDLGCGYSRDGQQETDIAKVKKRNPDKT